MNFSIKPVLIGIAVLGMLALLSQSNRVTKSNLIERADIIAVAQITSVSCETGGGCNGTSFTVVPLEQIKGRLMKGASVHMPKG